MPEHQGLSFWQMRKVHWTMPDPIWHGRMHVVAIRCERAQAGAMHEADLTMCISLLVQLVRVTSAPSWWLPVDDASPAVCLLMIAQDCWCLSAVAGRL